MEEWFALVQSAARALPHPDGIAESLSDAGLQHAEFGVLYRAYLCEPPVTFDMLADWTPYSAPVLLKARLDVLLDEGFLQAADAQEYLVTDKGLALIQNWAERIRAHLAAQTPLPTRDLQRLSSLLSRIVQAVLAAPPPPSHDRLLSNRRIAPVASAVPMVLIDQYLTDMAYFRDDAHVSAWHLHKLDGPCVEVLTLLWRGEAEDVDGLSQALSERRGHDRDDYATFVQVLEKRGLLDASQPTLTLTPQGQALREEIEATTNRYYMFPWTVLNPTDVQQLRGLLERFVQALSRA